MSFQQKCTKCHSKKVDYTEAINRRLYVVIYAAVLIVLALIGISVQGTPVIFLFLGLMGAFILFAVRMYLERKKVVKCVCLDCGERWQTTPVAVSQKQMK
ncbi:MULTISPECIES: hypothetical protein [Brevibacillus]|jgi:uncharacterized Tic20 family protein|uniref:Uncharacterized protein n=1 Tax=Brevibacillus parabrevis TaxID=54914 RepID=A0A4Y3PS36_BREPA|nr:MULTISPECIES: hypothetical protein [Brevibacillus]TGV21885.1 hypothetical protein EN829_046140 [Mesorhizobium sp. M00.F.Ca.ET.186.01.1.1]KZE49040.1 hypothetical protein AV540_15815 [Brevibacillus parabrevis]MBU8716151.1 hypothetical protein [Brevibacillus parabrevis]MDH6353363.1 putative Tic20 family protein [Brevibacillus sp. 1238]MDR5001604.1 hypothetical protein [Brevibacillus parabrevis]